MSSSSSTDRALTSARLERRPAMGGVATAILLAGILLVMILGLASFWLARRQPIAVATPYQAILLTNGSVYFGKLKGYGTSNPVLTDAFYVVSHADPNTRQVTNVLVKRGKELHGPDRMYINPSHIVFVETVGATSKVAELIGKAPAS